MRCSNISFWGIPVQLCKDARNHRRCHKWIFGSRSDRHFPRPIYIYYFLKNDL